MTAVAERDARAVEMTFDRTLARQLVHKAAVEQVLLTDARQLGDREFALGAHLPRSHAYYSDSVLDVYDQLLVLEIGRQGAVLCTHEFLGVPHDWQFIFSDIEARVRDLDALRRSAEPGQMVCFLSLAGERRRRGELTAGEFRAEYHSRGALAMTMQGTALYFNKERYLTARKHMRRWVQPEPPSEPPPPLPPAAVGRLDPGNVVIGEPRPLDGERDGYEAELIVDGSHATFFDHPLDHVPGALLIEGCRQTALACADRARGMPPSEAYVDQYSARYERLAELGASVRCRARVGEAGSRAGRRCVPVDIALMQFGNPIAESRFVLVSGRAR
jgi:hypothetical protein